MFLSSLRHYIEDLPEEEQESMSMKNFSPVGRCKVDPSLKASCFQMLILKKDVTVLFNLNPCCSELSSLRHYTPGLTNLGKAVQVCIRLTLG